MTFFEEIKAQLKECWIEANKGRGEFSVFHDVVGTACAVFYLTLFIPIMLPGMALERWLRYRKVKREMHAVGKEMQKHIGENLLKKDWP